MIYENQATAGATGEKVYRLSSGTQTASYTIAIQPPQVGGSDTVTPDDVAIALSIDNATITQDHVIQPQNIAIGLRVDASTVSTTPLMERLTDNFDDNTNDAAKWEDQTGGTGVETGGTKQITSSTASSYKQFVTPTHCLTGSYMYVNLIDAGSQALTTRQTIMYAEADANNKVYWQVGNGVIEAMKQVAGTFTSILNDTYSSTTHAWIRIRESGGSTYWDYSADGVSWSNFTSQSNPINTDAIIAGLQVGNYAAEASTSTSIFDNFNVSPSTVVTPSDIGHSLTLDATTISQNHVLPASDASLGLSIDNATITQNHVIVPQDIAVSLSTDNAAVVGNHTVAPDDIAVALIEETTTIAQTHIIAVQDISVGLSEDNSTITQIHVLAPSDLAIALGVDAGTVNTQSIITPQDVNVGLSADSATIAQNHVIDPADILHALNIDATVVTQQDIIILTDDISISVALDIATIVRGAFPESNIIITTVSDNLTIRVSTESITIRGIVSAHTIRGLTDSVVIRAGVDASTSVTAPDNLSIVGIQDTISLSI
jgi:hypothetical protein